MNLITNKAKMKSTKIQNLTQGMKRCHVFLNKEYLLFKFMQHSNFLHVFYVFTYYYYFC